MPMLYLYVEVKLSRKNRQDGFDAIQDKTASSIYEAIIYIFIRNTMALMITHDQPPCFV